MDNSINKNVVIQRNLKNLTQAQVAEKMSMKCSTYSQMERKGNISGDRLLKLAEIFEIDVSLLLKTETKTDDALKPDFFQFKPTDKTNTLQQPAPPIDIPPAMILTKKEESFIQVLRQLKEQDKKEVIAFLDKKYKNRLK